MRTPLNAKLCEAGLPGKTQNECWKRVAGQHQAEYQQRVSVALRKAVAKRLSEVYIQMGGAWTSPFSRDS